MVEDLELWDMPLQGGLFTWSSDLNNRFLISEDWEDHFPRVVQCVFPRLVFDYFPILLDEGGLRKGPTLFRFENMWLKDEDIKNGFRRWQERPQL